MSEVLSSGAVGIPLDGPLPRAPLYGLSSVALEVTPNPTDRAGAKVIPYPNEMPVGHDPCISGSLREKDVPQGITLPDGFPTFTAYLGDICTASGIGPWDEWKARSNIALAARENWALEAQLAGAIFAAAPSLDDADVDVLGGGAVNPATAIAYLEGAIADTGIEGVLHLTKQVVAYLGYEFFSVSGGILRTAAGTPVVSGSGYAGPTDARITPTGGGAAAAGQSWCYATGPVQYARQATIFNAPDTLAEALDRSDNTVIYRAERDLWVGWDKQLQAAVLADWSP